MLFGDNLRPMSDFWANALVIAAVVAIVIGPITLRDWFKRWWRK